MPRRRYGVANAPSFGNRRRLNAAFAQAKSCSTFGILRSFTSRMQATVTVSEPFAAVTPPPHDPTTSALAFMVPGGLVARDVLKSVILGALAEPTCKEPRWLSRSAEAPALCVARDANPERDRSRADIQNLNVTPADNRGSQPFPG